MGAVTTVAIRQPTDDPKNHTAVLRQLKEASETGSRQRGDPAVSYVQVREILSGASFTLVDGTLVPVPPTSTGWGAPKNQAATANFDGSSATLAQTSAAVAAILQVLIARGWMAK